MNIDNMDSRMSFIHAEEAARLLAFLVENPAGGSLNAAGEETASLREILDYIAKAANKTPLLQEERDLAPYNGIGDYSLCPDRARQLGFRFSPVGGWMFTLLDSCMASVLSGK